MELGGTQRDPTTKKHIFISYSHEDEDVVRRLVRDLQAAGFKVWIDFQGMSSGMPDWDQAVRDAIAEAHALLLIASPASRQSVDVQGEVAVAKSQRIPIHVAWVAGDVWSDSVSLSLIRVQYVDCRGDAYTTGLNKLAKALGELPATGMSLQLHLYDAVASVDAPIKAATSPLHLLALDASAGGVALSGVSPVSATLVEQFRHLERQQLLELVVMRAALTLSRHLRARNWDVVHFAGIDANAGFSVAKAQSADEPILNAEQLAHLLGAGVGPNVRVLVFASSFPTAEVGAFAPYAPYVLGVEALGSYQDTIAFIREFYDSYVHYRSVERAVEDASVQLDISGSAASVKVALIKRVRYNAQGRLLVEAQIAGFPEPLTVDLSQVEPSLAELGISKEHLFDLIAKKIYAHRVVFQNPRENIMLSIGSLLHGVFSWDTSAGYVKCHRVFRFRDNIDPLHWKEWCRLFLSYNDLCNAEYRSMQNPANPAARTTLAQGLHQFKRKYDSLSTSVDALTELSFLQLRHSYDLGASYLELADEKLEVDDLAMTVTYLDSALSALHDIVNVSMPETITGSQESTSNLDSVQ